MSNKNTGIAALDVKLNSFASYNELEAYAAKLIDSGFLPTSLQEPAQVIAVIEMGRELGLSPILSINSITVIKGRTTLSASLVGTLLKRHGIEWIITKDFVSDGTNKVTEYEFFWKSAVLGTPVKTLFSITWNQLALSGVTEKDNYKKYPKEINSAY